MKKISLLRGLLVCLCVLCGTTVFAQQNLFNIPSANITPTNKVFYQHQLNVYNLRDYASKHHFVYGLPKNWEVGLNVVNINIKPSTLQSWFPINDSERKEPFAPIAMLTAQKQIQLSKHLQLNIGTQIGTNLLIEGYGYRRLTTFSYALAAYRTNKHWSFVAGPYVTDETFMGKGNNAGVLVGFEIPLNKRWLLMGDFVSGNTKNSVSVLGFTYNVNKHFQLCLGGLVPNPNSKENYGVVFEINLFNF